MFSAIASTADIIRRHDYDVTNQPPSLAFIWQVEKSAPVHRHLHLRPSTCRVAADRHLASNAPRCSDRRYSQFGSDGLAWSSARLGLGAGAGAGAAALDPVRDKQDVCQKRTVKRSRQGLLPAPCRASGLNCIGNRPRFVFAGTGRIH